MGVQAAKDTSYKDAFFGKEIAQVDPRVDLLIGLEEERQRRRIILIPSESYAPLAVRQALGSVFTSIYAEGYPPSQMVQDDEELLVDLAQQLSYYRRYADRRYYKGADYVHLIETLAQRRAAACFANERARAEEIRVNVQPLSGAAANLAAYEALMEPGETLMGMDLFQGGHLTHGSEFNISGRRYRVVSYGSGQDGRLHYDEIMSLAQASRPKVILAGYTSYPWAPDFLRFREIADSVGAYLVADIAHPAGMVIAGLYPNPVGIADVVTFTTHKTLCGPRGACILTTDEELSRRIDAAVFPGLQGGPHTNTFAAMCVAFEIARSQAFRSLQQRIVENAQALAKGLVQRGLKLAYGGTDTHLLLLDLKSVTHPSHRPLYGEVVARILELGGIVVNKNTIPGDRATSLATGIRMGTPWVTQRGMGTAEMDELAELICRVVQGITPFHYEGLLGKLPRGKIDLDTLEEVKWRVQDLASAAGAELQGRSSAYPHYMLRRREVEPLAPCLAVNMPAVQDEPAGATTLIDMSDLAVLCICGWRAGPFMDQVCTADISGLQTGDGASAFLLDKSGLVLDDIVVWRMERDERSRDRYLALANPENVDRVASWLRGLSDGYVLFDESDPWRKVEGPVKVEVLSRDGEAGFGDGAEAMMVCAIQGPHAAEDLGRALGIDIGALFVGCPAVCCKAVKFEEHSLWVARGVYDMGDDLYSLIGTRNGVEKLWHALCQGGGRSGSPDARRALRAAAGLPPRWPDGQQTPEQADCRTAAPYMQQFPKWFAAGKPYFVGQDKLAAQAQTSKGVFAWTEPSGMPLLRTPLFGEHKALGARLVPFAGWEVPVWYSSVNEEHRAVRETAGLFDVGHMGVLEITGPHAAEFLDLVSVNYGRWMKDGDSQYAALLDPTGHILDDMWVYRRAWDRFLIVVNAVNADKDWAWLNAVNEGQVIVDLERPWVGALHRATLRNLKDPASGGDQRVDIALQGPASLDILMACVSDPLLRHKLSRLGRTRFVEGTVDGMELLISRTGYTGESIGFELLVHPGQAVSLWRMLLDKGAPYGIKPCGLAARDSTRIEAGLPLYGHELAGPFSITLSEAGFGAYVKYHKPFFVGRTPYKAYNDQSERRIARFQVTERGARALRGGEPVVSKRGKVIGTVTSCALVGDRQIGMALVDMRYAEEETDIWVYPPARNVVSKQPEDLQLGDAVALPVGALVLPRFPSRQR